MYQEGDINSKILILLLLFLRFAFNIESVSWFEKKSFRSFQYSKPLNIIVSKFQRYPILAPFSKNVSLCEKCARNQLCRIAIVLVFLSRRPWAPPCYEFCECLWIIFRNSFFRRNEREKRRMVNKMSTRWKSRRSSSSPFPSPIEILHTRLNRNSSNKTLANDDRRGKKWHEQSNCNLP